MSEGKGKVVVSERDGFRVLFRGVRVLDDAWCDVDKKCYYEYHDFFIADILNDGLPVDDINLYTPAADDVVVEDDDDEIDSEEEENEEKEEKSESKQVKKESKEEKKESKNQQVDVVVNDDDVLKPFCEPLVSCLGKGRMLRIDSSIFFVGTGIEPPDSIPHSIQHDYEGRSIRCLKSLARLDLDSDDNNSSKEWIQAPQPQVFGWSFESVAFGHKIYLLDTMAPSMCQIYDTCLNTWSTAHTKAPSPLEKCYVLTKLIADPDRNRVLVNFFYGPIETPTVYAWFPNNDGPDGHSWLSLIPHVYQRLWKKKPTIADGLLFFYRRKTDSLFSAYDLVTNRWLKTKWPVAIPDFLKRQYKAKSMIYMGNRQLCVAMSFPVLRPVLGSNVYFLFFKFSRSISGGTIFIRYKSMKLFYTRRIFITMDYIPLGDVC